VVESILCHSKDLKNVASERTLDVIQIDILEILTHDLLPSVVDQDMDNTKLVNVFLYSFLACLIIHEISGKEDTLATFFLDHSLSLFGILLFIWEVDDSDVCAFTCEEDSN
jgi:hypothetical protein